MIQYNDIEQLKSDKTGNGWKLTGCFPLGAAQSSLQTKTNIIRATLQLCDVTLHPDPHLPAAAWAQLCSLPRHVHTGLSPPDARCLHWEKAKNNQMWDFVWTESVTSALTLTHQVGLGVRLINESYAASPSAASCHCSLGLHPQFWDRAVEE